MNYEELKAEWESPERFGPKILEQVRSICAQTSKKYLAKTY